MAVIQLPQPYAVAQLRKDVRDSLMTNGEQVILLALWHPGEEGAVPCPQCGDDMYKSPEMDCTSCWGTMFDGGVRRAMKVWAMFSDKTYSEVHGRRGEFHPDQREIQLEAFPEVIEHDVVVRIRQWNADGTPNLVHAYYELSQVQRRSLRTGNRFGQWSWDVVAQKAQLSLVPESARGITGYPIVGQPFESSVQLTPATSTTPAALVAEPDTKVIFYEAAPAALPPAGAEPEGVLVFTQTNPASIWTVVHNFGYYPSVTVLVGGEEVDADVAYPDDNTVTITFGTPQVGEARLT